MKLRIWVSSKLFPERTCTRSPVSLARIFAGERGSPETGDLLLLKSDLLLVTLPGPTEFHLDFIFPWDSLMKIDFPQRISEKCIMSCCSLLPVRVRSDSGVEASRFMAENLDSSFRCAPLGMTNMTSEGNRLAFLDILWVELIELRKSPKLETI